VLHKLFVTVIQLVGKSWLISYAVITPPVHPDWLVKSEHVVFVSHAPTLCDGPVLSQANATTAEKAVNTNSPAIIGLIFIFHSFR